MTVKQSIFSLGFLLLMALAAEFGQGTPADVQKVHALLIILGNDRDIRASIEKNESSMQTLLRQVSENCEVHMTIMKSETETIGTITRMILSNARSANITEQKQGIISAKQVVRWLSNLKSNGEDTILIYYSGHGSMDAVGTHILNFDPEVTNDFLARDGLRKRLEQKRGRLKMLITDTCSNRVQTPPSIARVYAKVQSRKRQYTKNLFLEHTGILDITAASAGQYAWGNDEIGGYFTVSLIGSFTADTDANQDRFLSWKEVFDITRGKTQQLFRETTFLSHNQRKLDQIDQVTQIPICHELPRKLTQRTSAKGKRYISRNRRSEVRIPQSSMVLIPAGKFQMGGNVFRDEEPLHTVYVDTFYMDKYEVTNAQYRKFVLTNPQWQKRRIEARFHDGGYLSHWNGNNYPTGKDNYPVTYVSWYAAMAYARWAEKRLPTEAEWERAARGGLVGQKYPNGNAITPKDANYGLNVKGTTIVGRYPANTYGLYDMAGNVWEWCLDEYDWNFYSTLSRKDVVRNPISGANSVERIVNTFMYVNSSRVLRGGAWNSATHVVRVANRNVDSPKNTREGLGFRCVRSVVP